MVLSDHNKKPQIAVDLDSSFKCTGCSHKRRKTLFKPNTRTAGTGDTSTGVLFFSTAVHVSTCTLHVASRDL
jgi:hypothetical protein